MNGAVYSMTGFATDKLTQGITIDIRSVNSRFLDLSFKLPDAYRHLEAKLRELVSAKVRRGKCEVRLSTLPTTSSNVQMNCDTALVQRLLSQQTQILALAPAAPVLSVADFIALASVKSDSAADDVIDEAQVLNLMSTVLDRFMQARALEGSKLVETMLAQTLALRGLRQQVIPLVPALVEQQRQRFLQKFNDAVAESGGKITASAAEERALSEATAFAIRVDVIEEVDRLGSHLTEIENALTRSTGAKGQELGKRLEFLIQELHREANTLGSKSATLQTTKIAIEMKVLIEQLREQVQNIE